MPRTLRTVSAAMAALCLTLAALLFAAAAPAERTALVLKWDGAIGPATADYVARGLRDAAHAGAAIVVLKLDTPGGLDTSMREINRDIVASAVPVATYVHPSGARAASAGTYMLYASHLAAMSPGTNLGAATPVPLTGASPFSRDGDEEAADDEPAAADRKGQRPRAAAGTAMERKIVNDAVAYLRALADMRGRNADWAERAVRDAASLPAREALSAKVIDIVAPDVDDLLRQAHGRRVNTAAGEVVLDTAELGTVEAPPGWRIRLLATLTNPNVALIFMMIGVYGLIFEFMNPGALYPGTIGILSLLMGLYALAALPLDAAGAAFMVLGLVLMIAEAFVPAFGVLGIGGAVSFVIGATMLMNTSAPGFQLSMGVAGAVAIGSLVLSLVVLRLAWKASRRSVRSGRRGMVGASGEVLDWDGTQGHVHVHGERWQATAAQSLRPGTAVRVVAIDGLKVTVEAVADHPQFTGA